MGEGGIFKIKPFSTTPCLTVKHLEVALPSMKQYRQAGFPFSMLDETIISPRNTLLGRLEQPALLFLLRANFIAGGLLPVFSGQQNCMGMVGQGQIIHLFAKACRGEAYTSEELRIGNLSRRDLIPLLPENGFRLNPSPPHQAPPKLQPRHMNLSFQFIRVYGLTSSSLAFPLIALKSHAMSTVCSGYLSTDDALSAFIWQRVNCARRLRLSSMAYSTFDRRVDVRQHVGIPASYTGSMVVKTSTTLPVQSIISEAFFVGHLTIHQIWVIGCSRGHGARREN